MKSLQRIGLTVIAAAAITTASAGGLSSVLDGMFANVTAPDVVSNQFRGAITGGSVYVRSPMSNIQLTAIDPPRLSVGCGGIDLYLGSFSFITADKLTQFIRNVAQNAAPLAFKMALDASFPQLGGVLDKFQHMAQMMNDSQRNSCQLAHGIMDGAKNPEEVYNNMTKMVSDGISTVKGWSSDFTEAFTSDQTEGSTNVSKARQTKNADGTQVVAKLGNVTWNALNVRKNAGYVNAITDDPQMAQQVLMSMIGTQVNKEGSSNTAEPVSKSFPPMKVRLKDIFRPPTGQSGAKEIPIWSCDGDSQDCLSPKPSTFQSPGIEGYVRKKMFGSETGGTALPGSIIFKMTNCTSGNCGMDSGQLAFLNAVGRIPAVGMMMRAQGTPAVIGMIAPSLVDAMVDEISVVYGRAVLDVAISSYSNTELPRPDQYDETIKSMMEDLNAAEQATKTQIAQLNVMATYIDSAIRANGAILRYRPH